MNGTTQGSAAGLWWTDVDRIPFLLLIRRSRNETQLPILASNLMFG